MRKFLEGAQAVSTTSFTPEEARALEEKYTIPRMACLPGGTIGMVCLAFQLPNAGWEWQAFWSLFTSYFLFCWTSCFHETAHQTLTGQKWVSIWLGRALGTVMYVPYSVYRESHIRHHAYLNKPSDWELWPYSDPKMSLTFRRIFVWIDFVFGFVMSPAIYSRIYFHKDSPIKSESVRKSIRNEYLFMLFFWSSVIGLVAYTNQWWLYISVWLIPSYIAGLWQSIRKFTEHLGMSSYDPMLGTRTVIGNNWLTRMLSFINFDIFIHGPHHRHPRVAHNALSGKMHDYMEANPQATYPVFSSYARAICHTIPFMLRNPGVGMNAGAPAPGKAKDSDVVNFVADVTEEVLADSDVVIRSAK